MHHVEEPSQLDFLKRSGRIYCKIHNYSRLFNVHMVPYVRSLVADPS